MKIKISIIAILLLGCKLNLKTPSQKSIAQIGNICPDIEFLTVNHSKIKISQVNKPLILLELFDINCSAVSKHLRHIDSITKKYSDKIMIIGVTNQNSQVISQFMHDQKLTDIKIPIVTDDTLLFQLFPHRIVPEIVWLDTNLTVRSVGYGYDVTPKNIEAALNNNFSGIRQKHDNIEFNPKTFSFLSYKEDSNMLFASVVTAWHPELLAISDDHQSEKENYRRLLLINESIMNLYRGALHFWEPSNRVLIRSHNKKLFEEMPANVNDENWYASHLFCYEARLPLNINTTVEQRLVYDLNNTFNVKVEIRSYLTNCYVLLRSDSSIMLQTEGAKPMSNFDDDNHTAKWMHNLYLSSLISYLNSLPNMPPCIDETAYAGRVDLKLNTEIGNIHSLNNALSLYGLKLIFTKRKINLMVIEDL